MSDVHNHSTSLKDSDTAEDTVWEQKIHFIDSVPRWLAMTFVFVVFVGTWQSVTSLGLVSPIILPTPMETLKDMIFVGQNLLTGGYMLGALWITIKEVIYGFALAIAIGFSLGVLVGETAFGEKAVMPYLVAIDTMPKVAFAPLFVAWLGFGIESKVALAAFIATFPIVVGTAAGLHAADENARMLFKTMGASRMQTLFKMKLPTGLPQIFTGLKIGAVGVMAGAITGEFLGGGKGFGELIRVAASQLNTPRVFSLILYLSLVGLVVFASVVWTQRKLVFWHKEQVGRDDF
ncbi:Putative aliphatic sulfonates transport permease protein SsuC [Ruegeria atlantica]|uniref:Putative aliphatic sulfonates transport permease protein SsuC n=1 Tax=Ruegeria atlantica TaxID=81569 RepID=A0A0P1ERX0_9RHOB|nr:ABC transporter permease [Ruegeria atlantica]CUH45346.1 Putative aliphatic sulfonates transport permease protein SsuC [Ruegeria atlantica]